MRNDQSSPAGQDAADGPQHCGTPGDPPATEDHGAAWLRCMRNQDFAGAWAISDAVLAMRDPAGRDDPSLPYHLRWVWDGTPPHGRDVLVRCYHGLGDTLQFARFLPALRARAARVTVEAQRELCPLLAQLPGVDRLAPGLLVDALAPDGTVEAVRGRGAPGFVVGVQWHPEYDFERDPVSRRIFEVFGQAVQAGEGEALMAAD